MKKVTGGLYRQKCPNSDYGQEIAAERRQSVAPGSRPGFSFDTISAPGRKSLSESFAPSGLRSRTTPTPGLRPGLHSVAAPRLNAAQVLARAHSGSFLDRNHNLDRSPLQGGNALCLTTLAFAYPCKKF